MRPAVPERLTIAQVLSEFLRQTRETRRLSQKQLARAAGLSQSQISTWEAGLRGVRTDHIEAVLQALDMDASTMMEMCAIIARALAAGGLTSLPSSRGQRRAKRRAER